MGVVKQPGSTAGAAHPRELLSLLGSCGFGVYACSIVVSEKDRAHFRRIAEAEAELNRDAVRDAAVCEPGVNIALGIALSEFAASFGGDLSRPEEVSPAGLWRARTRQRAVGR